MNGALGSYNRIYGDMAVPAPVDHQSVPQCLKTATCYLRMWDAPVLKMDFASKISIE